jgi:hypothetical protein
MTIQTKGITITFQDPYKTPILSQRSITVFGKNLKEWLAKLSEVLDGTVVLVQAGTEENEGYLHVGHGVYEVKYQIHYNVYL